MITQYKGTILIPTGETSVDLYLGYPETTGRVHAIKIDIGTLTTPSIAITGEKTAVPIMTEVASGFYYPRAIPNKIADGAVFTNVAADIHVIEERIKVAVTSAGAAETGTITVYVDDGK